ELGSLRERIGAVLAPIAALIAVAALAAGPPAPGPDTMALTLDDAPLALALLVSAGAAIATVARTSHLGIVVMLSFVGFGLALVFAFAAAPNVALVAVLIETSFTVLFLAVLARVP